MALVGLSLDVEHLATADARGGLDAVSTVAVELQGPVLRLRTGLGLIKSLSSVDAAGNAASDQGLDPIELLLERPSRLGLLDRDCGNRRLWGAGCNRVEVEVDALDAHGSWEL